MPYPVDYGGVFDLFYKLPALQKQGVRIHLHCFDYGRGKQDILNNFCETVDYYQRQTGLTSISLKYPYIVSSRSSKQLLDKLAQDNYPILIEGIHCTFLLNDKRFENRKCFVRLHNVEHIYYKHLYRFSTSLFKKLHFYFESMLLERYEKLIAQKAIFWAVSEKDVEVYKKTGAKKVEFLPLFLPEWTVNTSSGKGSFCLYQGDLSVAENEKAATWLMEEVFADLDIPLVIAGKNPSKRLCSLVHAKATSCLIANPGNDQMQDLIGKAHINIIPSFNSTGVKLKLINALYNGRHCLVNEATVEGTTLEPFCYLANDVNSFITAIKELYEKPFEQEEMCNRHQFLNAMFNNERNAGQVVSWIWGD